MSNDDIRTRALQDITRKAYRLFRVTGGDAGDFESATTPVATSTLLCKPLNISLPDPEPIAVHLVARGIHPAVSERASNIHLRHANELKKFYERQMHSVLQSWYKSSNRHEADSLTPIASLQRVYHERYSSSLREWVSRCICILERGIGARQPARRDAPRQQSSLVEKRPFKQEALPALENAFSRNAYPTRAEKEQLALITGMDYKQVHVWFQNRRNRSRRDGHKCIRGGIFHHTPCVDLDTKHSSTVVDHALTDDVNLLLKHGSHTDACTNASISPVDELGGERPAHAYPAPYPPVCHYDPFPVNDSSVKLSICWPRLITPRAAASKPVPVGAVDELVISFNNMTLNGDVSIDSSAPPPSTLHKGRNIFTVTLPKAPLPSALHATSPRAYHSPLHDSQGSVRVRRPQRAGQPSDISISCRSSTRRTCDTPHPYPSSSRRQRTPSRSLSVSSESSVLSDASATSESSTRHLPLTPPPATVELPQTKYPALSSCGDLHYHTLGMSMTSSLTVF